MNRIDFTITGGILRAQDVMGFLQENFEEAFAGVASMIGDNVIVSGVADLGANYGDGWVVIAGELLPFQGGVKAANIIIQEDVTNESYGDGLDKPAYYTRYAKCAGVGGTPFVDFDRLSSIKSISDTFNSFLAQLQEAVPTGIIKMWPKTAAPIGWLVCDGSAVSRDDYAALFAQIGVTFGAGNGVSTFNLPNMKGKFVVGYDGGDADYNAINKTGGEKKHALIAAENGQHAHLTVRNNPSDVGNIAIDNAHPISKSQSSTGFNNDYALKSSNLGDADSGLTSSSGAGQAHENRPPYITLNYIIKY